MLLSLLRIIALTRKELLAVLKDRRATHVSAHSADRPRARVRLRRNL